MFLYTYVDEVLILFDERKTTEEKILREIKQPHRNLECKLILCEENCINFLHFFCLTHKTQ
jgi:hypothetical protein